MLALLGSSVCKCKVRFKKIEFMFFDKKEEEKKKDISIKSLTYQTNVQNVLMHISTWLQNQMCLILLF